LFLLLHMPSSVGAECILESYPEQATITYILYKTLPNFSLIHATALTRKSLAFSTIFSYYRDTLCRAPWSHMRQCRLWLVSPSTNRLRLERISFHIISFHIGFNVYISSLQVSLQIGSQTTFDECSIYHIAASIVRSIAQSHERFRAGVPAKSLYVNAEHSQAARRCKVL
jgi:hypothetical protein